MTVVHRADELSNGLDEEMPNDLAAGRLRRNDRALPSEGKGQRFEPLGPCITLEAAGTSTPRLRTTS